MVVGTRPEAIKLAPVASELAARGNPPAIVFTGQHPGLDAASHSLGSISVIELGCAGQLNPHEHARAVRDALLPRLRRRPPRLLVVQGDTSSAYGAGVAGATAGVPVAHVEAGLRSHDPAMPWPEEEYRTAIDARADLLFAPTGLAAENLRRERVPGRIFVTGNTGIDAVLKTAASLPPRRMRDRAIPKLIAGCHRRENWGEPLDGVIAALRQLASDGVEIDVLLPPNAFVAERLAAELGGTPSVTLLAPCSHAELVRRMRDCDLMLSDSGGVQEEAAALGTPLLVLRKNTERPEALATGNMRLVGTDTVSIIDAVRELLGDPVALGRMAKPAFPYGDGHAAPRIAAEIERWLACASERSLRRAG